MTTTPCLWLSREAEDRLTGYIQNAKGEISGLGTIERSGNNLIVTDVFLLKQECGPATTDLDSEAISDFLLDRVMKDQDTGNIKLWWHSHASMAVFWSTTDDKTAEGFGGDWMVSLVGNRNGDWLCRIDLYEPFPLMIDRVLVRRLPEINDVLDAEIKAEIALKVKHTVPVVRVPKRIYQPRLSEPTEDWEPKVKRLEDHYDDNGEWMFD